MAGHDGFLNDVSMTFISMTFIDKTDPSNPLLREGYKHLKHWFSAVLKLKTVSQGNFLFTLLHGNVRMF